MVHCLITIGLILFFGLMAWAADKLEEIGKKADEKELSNADSSDNSIR